MNDEERREQEIREELDFHLSEEAEELEAAGVPAAAAQAAARKNFGNRSRIQESVREIWIARRWHELRQDIRFALRSFRKNPGFVAAVVGCLALGIGSTAWVVSVSDAMVFRPLPYPEPERLVSLDARVIEDGSIGALSYPDFRDWRDGSKSFTHAAAWNPAHLVYGSGADAIRVEGATITAGYFETLGVMPRLGRAFRETSTGDTEQGEVIVTDGFWRRQLNADPNALDRNLIFNGESYRLAGVMPPDFRPIRHAWEVYLTMPVESERGAHYLHMIGRLAPGVTVEQAHDEVQAIAQGVRDQYSDVERHTADIIPLNQSLRGEFQTASYTLLGASILVLLIGCFNVANLMLARSVVRGREVSVRFALGAGRARIVRQMLTESLVLALAGATGGVLLAWGAIRFTQTFFPAHPVVRPEEIRLDGGVLMITIAVAVGCAMLFGLAPALASTRGELRQAMSLGRGQSGSRWNSRRRAAIVVAETAVAALLLIGASLFLRSFWNVEAVDPGFDAQRLVVMDLSISPQFMQLDRMRQFQTDLISNIRALPGVESAAVTSHRPLGNSNVGVMLQQGVEDYPNGEPPSIVYRMISPDYMKTMQIPLIRGRLLDQSDRAGTPLVMLINQSAAQHYWPNEDPIGKQVLVQNGYNQWTTIVGVVGDVKEFGPEQNSPEVAYYPFQQTPFPLMSLMVRSAGPPEELMPAMREVVRRLNPGAPPVMLRTIQSVIDDSFASRQFVAMLVAGFAGLALLLAAGGIFSQLSYAVAQRQKEIGLRLAMGASRGGIVELILRHGLVLTAVGLMLGVLGAVALSRLVQNMLFGIDALDAPSLAAAPAILLVVAMIACLIPAWKASQGDPATILHYE